MTTATLSRKLTPPELAKRYGVEPSKVIAWIKAGELRAVNIATKATGRPRYIIDEQDVAAFEEQRAAKRPATVGGKLS
jgi:transposase